MRRVALLLLTSLLVSTPAAAEQLELFSYFVGGIAFYIDKASLQNNGNGQLTFNVIGISPENHHNGGYSRYVNRIDCRTGTYEKSYIREEVDSRHPSAPSRYRSFESQPRQTMTIRYDGHYQFYKLRDLCLRESGLARGEYRWLDDQNGNQNNNQNAGRPQSRVQYRW